MPQKCANTGWTEILYRKSIPKQLYFWNQCRKESNPTLKLNNKSLDQYKIKRNHSNKSRSMSDPTSSDIDFKNKMALVSTTLNFHLKLIKVSSLAVRTVGVEDETKGIWSSWPLGDKPIGCRSIGQISDIKIFTSKCHLYFSFIFLCIFSEDSGVEVILTKIKKKEILTYLYMTVRIPIGAKQGATGQRFSLGIDFG